MKQTTEQQNTLREPESGPVDWVAQYTTGGATTTTTRVVVRHQFWHGARALAVKALGCSPTAEGFTVVTLAEWNREQGLG